MRNALMLFLILGISVLAFADPPDSLWSHTYGASDWEECLSAQQTTDGGYILAGYTQSVGDKDFWLVKTDAGGIEEWSYTYGGSSSEICYSVQQTSDNGYILAGYTQSFGAGGYDIWLVKTNANGDSLWSRTFGGSNREHCWSVKQTSDGGYILGGFTQSFGTGNEDFWIVKTDANGDSLWSRTFGGIGSEECISIQQTSDGGYAGGGYTTSYGAGVADFWFVKMNANGDSLWSRTYGGNNSEFGYSIEQTTDGGYIFGGYTQSFGSGNYDFWLVKTNTNGDSLWSRTYGGSAGEECYSVQQTTDGGYVLGGYTQSFGAGATDYWMVKADTDGDSLWALSFGGYSYDRGVSVRQTNDTGYIIGGYTQSFGAGARDFWVVKTGPDPSYYQLQGALSGTLGPGEYHVVGNISIQSNDTLTLMPGTVFQFDSLYEFHIDGTLLAEGTESDSIVFTADTVANPGRWRGLRFDGSSSSGSRLAYCLIENGHRTGGMPNNYGGGVYCTSSSPFFTHCVIRNNRADKGGGVYCTNSTSVFTNCTITGDSANIGGGVYCTESSTTFTNCEILNNEGNSGGGVYTYYSPASFTDCTISDNSTTGNAGGICCEQLSSLTLTNCTFSNNSAGGRAGAFLCYFSSPTFTNCTFNNNVAGNHGGGFYCSETSDPIFIDCVFQNNEANYGGGLSFASSSATFTTCTISGNTSGNDGGGMILNASSPILINCIISDNTSGDDGGGVNCFNASPNFTTCIISGNTASTRGGGISCENNSSPTLTDCAISGNSSHNDGGGMYCYSSSPDFTDCTIRSNSSVIDDGGGVYCQYSSPTFANCTIDSNYAQRDGGGLNFSYGSSPTVTDCIIRDNTANSEGGGMYCYESASMSINCTFNSNISHTHGGGAYCYEASPTFTNCVFNNNSCSFGGGGLGIAFSSPTITRCTISENSAGDDGGGMTCIFSSPIITSTVVAFSDNMGIWFDDATGAQFKYCNIFGNSDGDIVFESGDPSNGPPGIGQLVTTNANDDSSDVYYNILLDPMFVDTAANDYHLLESSPCIDAGDPTLLPDSDGTVVEIGAFYFPQEPPSYTLSPDSLDFSEVLYRENSTLSFWIHNPTDNPLHAAGIRVTDTLIFHAHPTSAQIPPQDSVEIELTFMPRRNISYLDSVQISFGGLDENETVIVQGMGIYDCHVLDGAVSSTLSMACSPYYVAGEVTLEENDTLIIEAGVEVIFDWHCQFLVNGLLLAIGTAQDSIKFTCDTLFNPNHWGGIHFYFAHDSCRMEYSVIEKGRAEGDSPDNQGGGIFCSNSSPIFAHCTIANNWAEDAGGGVHCRNNSSPAFTYCTISNNVVDYYGGGIYC
ncbi:right-handed parallel beta-helix repeat-containing protein, partial [bacterium]|nr:right-handed parallel beta-helix repeat-containing protein [bacterium]